MKKILIITYYWPPSGGAGVQRWLKFTKYLTRHGYTPVILTVKPENASYPQIDHSLDLEVPSSAIVERTKTVEIYNLYKLITGNKELPYGGFSNEKRESTTSKISKAIRGNLFIPDPRRGWNRFAVNAAKDLIKRYNISTIITTSPPHSTQLIGLTLKRECNVNWIADFRDPWTDIFYYSQLRRSSIAKKIELNYEKRVLLNADLVVTTCENTKELFKSRVDHDRFTAITNGYDEDDFSNITPTIFPSGKTIITYTGTLSKDYDISALIKEVAKRDSIILNFVGNLADTIKTELTESKVNFIDRGYLSHKEAIENMLGSDILLLATPEANQDKAVIHGKTFEYLRANKPILSIGAVGKDAATIIEETGHGVAIDYRDSEAIAAFIDKGYRELKMGDFDLYSRENLTLELIKEIEKLENR